MVLTPENTDQVKEVVRLAMSVRAGLDFAQGELKKHRTSVDYWEEQERRLSRERDEYQRQIKALGFHDIGHARTELGKPLVCGACQCLVTAHHGPGIGCEGAGGNCGCTLTPEEANKARANEAPHHNR